MVGVSVTVAIGMVGVWVTDGVSDNVAVIVLVVVLVTV